MGTGFLFRAPAALGARAKLGPGPEVEAGTDTGPGPGPGTGACGDASDTESRAGVCGRDDSHSGVQGRESDAILVGRLLAGADSAEDAPNGPRESEDEVAECPA